MFSRRLEWPFPSNRLSRLLEDKRARGARVLDLTESNPTRVALDYPTGDIESALRDAAAGDYEPSARGMESARKKAGSVRSSFGYRTVPVLAYILNSRHV